MAPERFESEVLTIDHDGHVATLWLDRSDARNAMGRQFFDDLPRAMASLDDDDGVRAIVLAARGPHFCVGLDLKEMGPALLGAGEGSASGAERSRRVAGDIRHLQRAANSLAASPKPVIAAVQGYCIGGGVDLIAACDVRVAAHDAIFSVREAKMAIVADLGSLQRLPKIIGQGHVAELALSGKDIDAARAATIGLVNHVLDSHEATWASARAIAQEIAANSPLAVQGTKAVLAANDGRTVDEALDYVANWNTMYLSSADLTEALTSFLEKRPAASRAARAQRPKRHHFLPALAASLARCSVTSESTSGAISFTISSAEPSTEAMSSGAASGSRSMAGSTKLPCTQPTSARRGA